MEVTGMISKDYYLILGVKRDESSNGIRSAYLRLAAKYHPDRVGSKWSAKFNDIVEAYQALSNPTNRRHYNMGLYHAEGVNSARREPIVSNKATVSEPLVPSPQPLIENFSISREIFESFFDRFPENFIGASVPKSQPPNGFNVELFLSPYEAMRGGRVPIKVPALYPCPYCADSKFGININCRYCLGRGVIAEEETILVQIPSMVKNGTVMSLHMQGLGVHNFYLNVKVRIRMI
jgi:molecular chaperone DnaJ